MEVEKAPVRTQWPPVFPGARWPWAPLASVMSLAGWVYDVDLKARLEAGEPIAVAIVV